jgi:2-oxoglutarate ferredoxin oxidoreductase subunit beta
VVLDSEVAHEVSEVVGSGILDYRSEALPTWCPGCGYYGITMGITRALSALAIENRNLVVVTGIGCAGRYPFFVRGYGFHCVHGRALPVACGIKMARPELTVVAIGGDGDGLAIGGGHLPHVARRNVDVTYILFDNAIYGLTKGQASPTTPQGQVTSTTPYGTPDAPLNPTLLALAHGASFVARGWAGDFRGGEDLVSRALAHKGFSFLHFVSPCVTFDKVNLTWDRVRLEWRPVPQLHDPRDLAAAMALAIDPVRYQGVFREEPRPVWGD